MRAIAILAALAMVGGLFFPWLKSSVPELGIVPWEMVKLLEPDLKTVQDMASHSPELLAFLSTFALAALFAVLAMIGLPSRLLAFLAGGGAVAMVAYGVFQLQDQARAMGLPIPSSDNIAELLPRLTDFLGLGAMLWAGGAAVLFLTALIGFPSRR
ncbi:hypothetical protein Q9295_00685 [Xinfangfangia sp. CPCC 101601]|uniref:DUF1772 domain-containing protein n=1 Tax=Pseudogemmobacter lacusdianii TaxID=3069608 RepID=A0ABU0VV73_9RHOB|nr:hypothetical protein [Xinfangfangia sp. CPCC 101601]MDQ2064875.1 hypothetical protein [Xinfangfangia sp. CPCC 101601]